MKRGSDKRSHDRISLEKGPAGFALMGELAFVDVLAKTQKNPSVPPKDHEPYGATKDPGHSNFYRPRTPLGCKIE